MAQFSDKIPPAFDSKVDSYDKFVRKFRLWQSVTNVDKKKQANLLVLRMDEDTQDSVLEAIEDEVLQTDEGIEEVIGHLDSLFKKDEGMAAFELYEEFEAYRRKPGQSISEFCNEFQKRWNKVQRHSEGTTMSEDILAYRVLKAANLTLKEERLLKATVGSLKYDEVVKQLKKVFTIKSIEAKGGKEIKEVKTEAGNEEGVGEPEETYFNKGVKFKYNRYNNNSPWRGNRGYNASNQQSNSRGQPYQANSRGQYQPSSRGRRGRNPVDRFGNQTKCSICQSINHYAKDCPDRNSSYYSTYHQGADSEPPDHNDHESFHSSVSSSYNIQLYQNSESEPTKLKGLLYESLGAGVIDSGAVKTVCGNLWLKCYLEMLTKEQKELVKYTKSNNVFKFGDGGRVESLNKVKLPAIIGKIQVCIETDVVNSDIPMLISKQSLIKAQAQLNFQNDSCIILNQHVNLKVAKSGHYLLPLNEKKQIIIDSERKKKINVTLFTRDLNPTQVAQKLHSQFAHPPAEKLIRLVKTQPGNNKEVVEEIRKVSNSCTVCQEYKKPPPRPIVSLPMATRFGETVAMDLKQFGNVHLLHMIDMATRLSAGAVIHSKKPEVIVREIFKQWISVYGTPEKFLSDNGGEFNNPSLRELCEKCNIVVLTTAAESPWSNGVVESHNRVIADMVRKVKADSNCTLEMAVMWSISAHNSLRNINGFSPFQLVFSRNPTIPALLDAKPPALSEETTSEMVRKNLETLHKARQAYIASENCERLKRALSHNLRTTGYKRYFANEKVYYKRMDSKKWHGPGVVLGQDSHQVLIKHGGILIRVHPCRVSLAKETHVAKNQGTSIGNSHENQEKTSEKEGSHKSESETDTEKGETESDGGNETDTEKEETESDDDDVPEVNRTPNNVPEVNQTLNYDENQETEQAVQPLNRVERPRNIGQPSTVQSLKKGMVIRVKYNDQNSWEKIKLVTRAGKVGGKYQNEWNVINDKDEQAVVNMEQDVDEWEEVVTAEEEMDNIRTNSVELIPYEVHPVDVVPCEIFHINNESEIEKAKLAELRSWKENNVYTEVEKGNQSTISVKWVIKPKLLEGLLTMKARLVLRGYEEQSEFRKDSPTCKRESIRFALVVMATKHWKLHSSDFKTAFLQGKQITRKVYIVPPKEASTNKLWCLNKTVYGLSDAPRQWFLRLQEELIISGCKNNSIDPGVFHYHLDDELAGILLSYVDDIIYGGGGSFFKNVVNHLRQTFRISHEHDTAFGYIGLQLNQNRNFSISLDQQVYADSLQPVRVEKARIKDKNASLNVSEFKSLRSLVGQLGWLAGVSRPDISFAVSEASSALKNAVIEDIINVNKIVKHVKNTPSSIMFPCFQSLSSITLKVYSDASYRNLKEGRSQGGHIIFISDGLNSAPIAWHSTKIKRIVRSSTASETLSLLDACDTAYQMSKLISECLTGRKDKSVPIHCFTDSKNLFGAAHSSGTLSDKVLLVEIASLRERIEQKEISLQWVNSTEQIADVLTKNGASCSELLSVLSDGKL